MTDDAPSFASEIHRKIRALKKRELLYETKQIKKTKIERFKSQI
jgi:hypothetical protein